MHHELLLSLRVEAKLHTDWTTVQAHNIIYIMEEFDTTPSNDNEDGEKNVSAEKTSLPPALSENEEDMNRPTVLEDDDSPPIPLSMDAAVLDDEAEHHQEEKRKSDLQLVPSDDVPLPLHHLEETTSSNNDNSDVATMKRQIMESRGATTT